MAKSVIDVLTAQDTPASFWFARSTLQEVGVNARQDPAMWGYLLSEARKHGVQANEWERAVDACRGPIKRAFPKPQTGTELLAEDIPPLHAPVKGLLHEGFWLFGGKSKRGKSYLMLDMATSIATGHSLWGHPDFPTIQGPVLYLALEDGKRRVKDRLLQMYPSLSKIDDLNILYEFPRLNDGAIEMLADGIKEYGYVLVVIDVLAKILGPMGRESDKYQEFYKQFDSIRDLTRPSHTAIVAVDHLRKQAADDVFDEIQGSVAKAGATDALMVLERKPNDPQGFLYIRSKDIGDATHALLWHEHRFQYLGEGEAYTVERDQQIILRVLHEEQRAMDIKSIMQAGGFPEASYGRVRKLLMTMRKEDLLHRTKRGQYAATVGIGMRADIYDDDDTF